MAGFTVAVMLIPQGMAYAMIAGLSPIHGLYTSIVPLLVYAAMGTSRHLQIGPAAMVSLLTIGGINRVEGLGPEHAITLAAFLAFASGLVQILMGAFRMGFMVSFLSHPVLSGFTSAAAIIIAFNQLKHLLGVDMDRSSHLQELIAELVHHAGNTNTATLLLGLAGIAIIVMLRIWNRKIPGALIAVLSGILAVHFFKLDTKGVEILGEIPGGFPAIKLPNFEVETMVALLPSVFTIALIGFVETVAIAKAVERKVKTYRINSDQELIALGSANVLGSFFQIYPVAGSFSRTAINEQSGAVTQMAGGITGLLILMVILFFTPLFYNLPNAILASVILVAVYGLLDWAEVKHLWKTDRNDLMSLFATFFMTLFTGVEFGILTGVVISLVQVIYRSSKPHYAVLGKLNGSTVYKNIERYTEAEEEDGILVIRPDAPIYFANMEYLRGVLETEIARRPDTRRVLVDCVSVSYVDSSALHTLTELIAEYNRKGITFRFLGLIGPVRDVLRKNNMRVIIGKDHSYMRVYDAVLQYRAECVGEPAPNPRERARDPLEEPEL